MSAVPRLSIKLLKHANKIINRLMPPLCKGRWQHEVLTVGFKKCCKYRTYSIFGVFRFFLSRGTIVHLPSQENEIQKLSQQPAACQKYFFDNKSTADLMFAVLLQFL